MVLKIRFKQLNQTLTNLGFNMYLEPFDIDSIGGKYIL